MLRFAIHASISDSIQATLPPMSRLRGNVPSRIHFQMVGYDTGTLASSSRRDSSRGLALVFVFLAVDFAAAMVLAGVVVTMIFSSCAPRRPKRKAPGDAVCVSGTLSLLPAEQPKSWVNFAVNLILSPEKGIPFLN
jgi:hypothetical protein